MTLTEKQSQMIMDALAIADMRLSMGGSGAFKAEIDAIREAIEILSRADKGTK